MKKDEKKADMMPAFFFIFFIVFIVGVIFVIKNI